MMTHTWYTVGSEHLHLRFDGPLQDIWEFGMLLHERTPLLCCQYVRETGLLFVCIDARAKGRLHLLQHRNNSFSMLHRRRLLAPEVMEKFGGPPPFRLSELPIQPYEGEIGALRLRSTTPGGGPLRYYRCVDTPTAEIARQLAPFFPIYCFAAKTTQVTYLAVSAKRLRHSLPALQRAFPALQISLRFDLPHESTSDTSPIQRFVYYEPCFSRNEENSAANQLLRTLLPGIPEDEHR